MGDTDDLVLELAQIVAEGGPRGPERIGEACVEALPVSGASITVMAEVHREPIWASDDIALGLGQMQFSLGEGPCVEAFTEGRPVLVPDLGENGDHRWPMFAAAALRTPVRAVYSLPIQVGTIAIGVLDLYRDERGLLEPTELVGALRGADAALWALLGLRSADLMEGEASVTGHLGGSPLRHSTVYQATGMIMAQLEVSPEAALSRLRAHAFVRDRALDEVAHDVVTRRLRFHREEQG